MDDLLKIFNSVKSDFCSLFEYKLRGNTIELITGTSTITNSFVSVFITIRDRKVIVSDGGWVDQGIYNNEEAFNDNQYIERITSQLIAHYNIKTTKSKNNTIYYYKSTDKQELVSGLVLDVSQYIASLVNAQSLTYRSESTEDKLKLAFYNEVNTFFKNNFEDVEIKSKIKVNMEDYLKFDCIFRLRSRPYVVMYITGSSASLFQKDITNATVNFQAVRDMSNTSEYFVKLAILNTRAKGYKPGSNNYYLQQLAKTTDSPPIDFFDINQLETIGNAA